EPRRDPRHRSRVVDHRDLRSGVQGHRSRDRAPDRRAQPVPPSPRLRADDHRQRVAAPGCAVIELPVLDDRTFADFAGDARALIPSLSPGWTDHNPSDPGIALVELLAWLAEIVLYRIDRVPERSYRTFLDLLRGPPPTPDPLSALSIDDAIRTVVADLRDRHRAITADDFEFLTLNHWPTTQAAIALGAQGAVRRVLCIPQQSPATLPNAWQPGAPIAEGHVMVIIVPDVQPVAAGLLTGLLALFNEWRLLTTHVHVFSYTPQPFTVTAKLY